MSKRITIFASPFWVAQCKNEVLLWYIYLQKEE